jgi:hypothetical protein
MRRMLPLKASMCFLNFDGEFFGRILELGNQVVRRVTVRSSASTLKIA